uniref:Uncharacterized protein n=1 Tax=Aegilops tauschii subsp. strangulata TaxID=200361 RepID=A0A452ZR41_AEGTS
MVQRYLVWCYVICDLEQHNFVCPNKLATEPPMSCRDFSGNCHRPRCSNPHIRV